MKALMKNLWEKVIDWWDSPSSDFVRHMLGWYGGALLILGGIALLFGLLCLAGFLCAWLFSIHWSLAVLCAIFALVTLFGALDYVP